jgi:carbonic anhydrase/acetyltransferase-like protein (isoleucine patch superfamily)
MTRPDPSRVAHRHASASRVVRRHVAGLFEPPPRVVKAIEDWTLSVYAGHVLAYIQNKIDTKPDDTEKRLAQTQKHLRDGHLDKMMDRMRTGDLLRIPAGRNTDVVIKKPDLEDVDFGYSYQGDLQVLTVKRGQRAKFPRIPDEGASKYDPDVVGFSKSEDNWYSDRGDYIRSLEEPAEAANKVEAILRKGLETYSKEVRQNVREKMSPERLVELELMRREAEKFTSKAKAYRAKARTTLPIDLSGWKYLDGMPASEVEQKQAEANFTAFTCVLYFIGHKERGGIWIPSKQELQVDVSNTRPTTLKAFRNEIQWIRHVARHEGIHLGQTALQIVKDLDPWRAGGYPAFDMQEEKGKGEYVGGKRLPHPRRSVEFYARLPDEVERFAVAIKSIPLPKRRGYMRNWFDTRPFFRENKKHNLSKWKKMVGEFVSEVEKQGIYIPASTSVSETATISESATIGPDTHIEGSPYISGQAEVLGAATVKDNARVRDKAVVKGHAIVGGQGMVLGQATISGSAVVSGAYIISGDAVVKGRASIEGGSGRGVTIEGLVSGGVVKDNARVLGTVFGGVVEGRAIVDSGAAVKGDATVGGSAFIGGRAVVSSDAVVMGNTRIEGSAQVSGGRWDGEHVTSGWWSEPPRYPELGEGAVAYLKPRGRSQYDRQWVVVGEVLGKGMEQESGGVIREPNRYGLWGINADRMVFLGDWDDFDLDLTKSPSGTEADAIKEAWERRSRRSV